MPKTKISEFDVDPANNTDINSINIAEGCAPSGINNAIRQLMSDLKEFQTGAGGDPFNGAVNGTVGATTPNTGAFTTLTSSSTTTLNGTTIPASKTLVVTTDIGSTVQAYDVDTAKLDVAQSWSAAQSFNAGVTLGDASGDALTINSSAVSIPNGLNFDSNTLVIDATNNRVGVGTASPTTALTVAGVGRFLSGTEGIQIGHNGTIGYIETAGNSATPITFYNGGTERMRIDSSGNVGIGTSSPASGYKLDVIGGLFRALSNSSTSLGLLGTGRTSVESYLATAGNAGDFVTGTSAGDTVLSANKAGAKLFFSINGANSMLLDSSGNLGLGVTPSAWSGKAIEVGSKGTAIWNLSQSNSSFSVNAYYDGAFKYGGNNAASSYQQAGGIHYWYTAPSGTAGNAITFTQAMTLDSSGNLLVGTTDNYSVGASSYVMSKNGYVFANNNTGSSSNRNWVANVNGQQAGSWDLTNSSTNTGWPNAAYRFTVTSGGSCLNTTGSYGAYSDINLKENISDARNYLDDLQKVRIVKYSLKEEQSDKATKIGVIAQEIEQIFPSLVDEGKTVDGETVKSVKYSVFVPMLIKAVQELKAEVDSLKAQLNK